MQVYPKNHSANLPYSPHGWYANHSHHPGNQYLGNPGATGSGTPLSSAGSIGGGLENESSMYYAQYPHMYQPSPEYAGHDNLTIAQNSMLQSAMGQSPAALHFSQALNSGLANSNTNAAENLSSQLQNVPPSPPITVNSGCSEMSSPGIGNSGGSGIGNGSTSPHLGSGNSNTPRSKSPYDWMKKPSYQSQPNSGKSSILFPECCSGN